jgi:type I restriction enzyme S subunit
MSFPRYPKYKDSGVEWLGEVPEEWTARRLGYYFNERREKVSDRDYPALSVTKNGIVPQLETAAKTDDGDNRKRVRVGDFVINSRSDRKGSAGVADAEGSVSLISTVLSPRSDVLSAFVHHLLRSVPFQEEFYRYGKGIVADLWSTNYGEMRNILLAVPPRPEQAAIATFLDRETTKIDALIAEQQRLIELLQEKRQSVISHAVTKGLNPDMPMKDSGIEWLGKVPEHWTVRRIGVLFREVNEQGKDDLPILSVSIHDGVSDKEMAEEELDRKVTRSDDRTKYKRVAAGDLVYNMMRAWQGGFGTVAVDGMVSPAYVVARPRSEIVTSYVEHVLRTPAAVEQMRRHSRGITDFRLRLYWDEFKNISVPVPPLAEIKDICAAIYGMAQQADALEGEAQQAITLLQERRSALISAAVTGQIDVRGLAGSEAA